MFFHELAALAGFFFVVFEHHCIIQPAISSSRLGPSKTLDLSKLRARSAGEADIAQHRVV